MAFTASIIMAGDKVVIGALDMSFLSATSRLFPGTLVANGPCYFGTAISPGIPTATVMIGPPIGISAPLSLRCDGIANFHGVVNVIAVSTFMGLCTKLGTTIKNALSLKNGIDIKNALSVGNAIAQHNGNMNVSGFVTIQGLLAVGGNITCAKIFSGFGAFASVAAPFKKFDIPHPTKEGMRLRHACIEGAEIGVYHRGTVQGNVINLPEYWKGLVDHDTITVTLTPIQTYQELSYEVIEWGTKIKVLNSAGGPVNCSFVVYGERKDVDKLEIEYEGKEIQ